MEKILVEDLEPETIPSTSIYLDGSYLLLSPETPIHRQLLDNLKKWGYKEVIPEGKLEEIAGEDDVGDAEGKILDEEVRERKGRREIRNFYLALVAYAREAFVHFRSNKAINLNEMAEKIKDILAMIRSHSQYILRIPDLKESSGEYLVTHSVRSTILALAIGEQLKLPGYKLIELGVSALFHEVGMNEKLMAISSISGDLGEKERKIINMHPILGYRLLKKQGISRDVLLGILEHHERLDGSGYPQGLKGEGISLSGRILAVACSYDAQVSNRPHRDSKGSYKAMIDILKGMGTFYDQKIAHKLVVALSVYPLGSFVSLENGHVGVVVKSNPNNPRTPKVKILANQKGIAFKVKPTIATQEEGPHKIAEVLEETETRLQVLV